MAGSGERFGSYALLTELGRGGQGVVWLANDTRLGRKVALKLLNTGPVTGTITDREIARFRREAEAASKLDHPNICTLLDAGDVDGVPFLAFRYVDGETLAERIEQLADVRRGPTDEARTEDAQFDPSSKEGVHRIVAVFEKIARALHKAHEKGLIHRDIKPGNLMLDEDGEPVVLDFGLAREEIGDGTSLTHSGDLLGTPAYMSPEQLMAHRVPLDRRTDVYSLGATLYECLTLKKPFTGLTRAELYQQILSAEPTSATSVNRQIPRDLQVVIETAMDRDRNRRYQSALDLAEDLRRFREFQPIQAKPIGRVLRTRRWAQRHPVLATTAAGIVVALAASLFFLLHLQETLRDTRAVALARESAIAQGSDQTLALLLALEAVATRRSVDTYAQLHATYAQAFERLSFKHDGASGSVAFHPQDEEVLLTSSMDHTIRLWSTTGHEIQRVDFPCGVLDAQFAPDGTRVVAACADGIVRLYRYTSRELRGPPRELKGHGDMVLSAEFSHDGNWIVTASQDGTVRLWSVESGTEIRSFVGTELVTSARFSLDDRLVLVSSGDRRIRLYRVEKEQPWREFHESSFAQDASFVQIGGGAQGFLSGGWDAMFRLRDLDGRLLMTCAGHAGGVSGVSASSDGTWILTSSSDQSARIWDRDGKELISFRRRGGRVFDAAFAPSETAVATSHNNGSVSVWDLQVPQAPVLRAHDDAVRGVVTVGATIVTASADGRVVCWDQTGKLLRVLVERDPAGCMALAVSPDGEQLAVATRSGRVSIIDRASSRRRTFSASRSYINHVEFSPDGKQIVTANTGKRTASRWTLDGALLQTYVGHTDDVLYAEFTDRPGEILTASDDKTVRLWGARGEVILKVPHPDSVFSVEFRQGEILTAAGNAAYVWNRSGHLKETLAHESAVTFATFSADGTRILTACRDKVARIWNREGDLLAAFRGHAGIPWRARFLEGTNRIVTGSFDRTVRIWITDPEELLRLAKARVSRGFTAEERARYGALLIDR